ncbi:WXG100 family type VII secretion target [Actinotignum sanguinis]|uniref:ESAT-6-like protein n=2 Tax=Actinomycetaceae TaxID=2049 RepID=A0ABZ0RAI2_9ACTO|nr:MULTISPECIES: WXG100 family type VII secretion target [Actinotignum]WPJ89061.1 WXG100 family type VII secretion target [Schaalia turicensis]MDE1553686.1 WXG100 family type VII secretion target [Actinotignum sanguinis]MDE1564658.1 WXG100 family type VII secretion target [Actinotignum sanguinis]MDE1576693.1 WXG100 family type VII secretion target [Actinotignum sanguinis]MDE1642595.1 WXG100 family type VII secretion target [Actinotignum sanguinis]
MTEVRAHFGELSAGAADMAAHASRIEAVLAHLDARIRTAMADWDGQSQAAYEAAQMRWHAAARSLNDIYARIGQQVECASQNYRAADRAVARLFG